MTGRGALLLATLELEREQGGGLQQRCHPLGLGCGQIARIGEGPGIETEDPGRVADALDEGPELARCERLRIRFRHGGW